MPVPSRKDFTYVNIWGHGFDSLPQDTGCRNRPEINFKTAVAEGKQRRHERSKTQASRAVRMMFCSTKPCFARLPKRTDV